jgi:hypothetical protein
VAWGAPNPALAAAQAKLLLKHRIFSEKPFCQITASLAFCRGPNAKAFPGLDAAARIFRLSKEGK